MDGEDDNCQLIVLLISRDKEIVSALSDIISINGTMKTSRIIGPQEEGVQYNQHEAYPRVGGYNARSGLLSNGNHRESPMLLRV